MEKLNDESGNNSSTEADVLQNHNSPVDQIIEMVRKEEECSQMVNVHRARSNHGDGDKVGNSASAPAEQRGGQNKQYIKCTTIRQEGIVNR